MLALVRVRDVERLGGTIVLTSRNVNRILTRDKQRVALTGRNRAVSAARPPTRPAAGLPARRQRYRRRQVPASKTILAHKAGQ